MKQKGKYESVHKNRWTLGILFLSSVLICLILLFCVTQCQSGNVATDTLPTGNSIEPSPGTIAIPGYEGIELKANSKKQSLRFPNPAQNVCYFQISLCMEDGTKLWESSLFPPGGLSEKVALEIPLKAGTYPNAVLIYKCFALDAAKTPLNGAETKLTLWVK